MPDAASSPELRGMILVGALLGARWGYPHALAIARDENLHHRDSWVLAYAAIAGLAWGVTLWLLAPLARSAGFWTPGLTALLAGQPAVLLAVPLAGAGFAAAAAYASPLLARVLATLGAVAFWIGVGALAGLVLGTPLAVHRSVR